MEILHFDLSSQNVDCCCGAVYDGIGGAVCTLLEFKLPNDLHACVGDSSSSTGTSGARLLPATVW